MKVPVVELSKLHEAVRVTEPKDVFPQFQKVAPAQRLDHPVYVYRRKTQGIRQVQLRHGQLEVTITREADHLEAATHWGGHDPQLEHHSGKAAAFTF